MSLREELNNVLWKYIEEFQNKHELQMEFAVSNDLMGVISFGDMYFFGIHDIVEDIDKGYPKGMILDWLNDTTDYMLTSGDYNNKINLNSYAMGARFKKIDLNP